MVNINVPLKVSLESFNEKNVETRVIDLLTKYKKNFIVGLKLALASPSAAELLIGRCIEVLNDMQQEYWGEGEGGSVVRAEDPTQFGLPEQHEKVRREIINNLRQSAASLSEEGIMTFDLFSDEFISEGSDPETSIPWMHHFCVGGALFDNLVWINPEVRSLLYDHEGYSDLGRFGVGHLWRLTEMTPEQFNGWLVSAKTGLTFDQIRHPQSGKSAREWFEGVLASSGFSTALVSSASEYARVATK